MHFNAFRVSQIVFANDIKALFIVFKHFEKSNTVLRPSSYHYLEKTLCIENMSQNLMVHNKSFCGLKFSFYTQFLVLLLKEYSTVYLV